MLGDDYRGALGAFPYAARHSDSWLLRSYVVVAGLLALFVSLALVFALVTLIADTAALKGGSTTLSRAFYGVVGLFVVFPLVAPVLAVARRHRRESPTRRHDFAFAVAGYVFVLSVYAGLLASTPPARRDPASAAGVLEPVVAVLYDAPAVVGLLLPTLAAAALGALWWRTR